MKLGFKQKLILSFLVIFSLYTIAIILFERQQNKIYKTETLQSELDGYTEIIHKYIQNNKTLSTSISAIEPIVDAMPQNIRVTIIDSDGKVLYDKSIDNHSSLANHLDRIEIKGALYQDFGTNIRKSTSTKSEYLYYAKYYSTYFVRVALPYNVHVENLLKPDDYFIYTTTTLFLLVLLLLYFAVNRFNKSILNLQNLTSKVKNNEKLTPSDIDFRDDELGSISNELVEILDQKEKGRIEIGAEREKLRKHFQYSEEGLAIFDSNFKKTYINTHFIQFANILTDTPTLNASNILENPVFSDIVIFIKERKKDEISFNTKISKEGRIFSLKSIVFEDNSFELTIKDITKIERNRILKQEMTSNIAHELRTPITALRGFLETIQEQKLTPEKEKDFLEKAYKQSIRLSSLIEDISILSKIEEEQSSFNFEAINFLNLANNVKTSFNKKLDESKIKFHSSVSSSVIVNGNYNLLFSVIQNLIENTCKYAGKDINIQLDCYTEDNRFYYFSYYDTGKGVNEKYLSRLFERFHRIDEGRDRASGGSGLGLSIVRNIISLHKGDIQAKIHSSGGLQFIFKLEKFTKT